MTRLLPKDEGAALASSPGESLVDRYHRVRNRILSDPTFQRWAARFPLTRFIARRRASALFDLTAGFVYSQVLHAAVRVGMFEVLAAGPATAEALAPRLGLPVTGARRLLDAAASLRLAERRGQGRYGLGVHGAALLGNPAVARMVEHHVLFYRDLEDPVRLLREPASTELSRFWAYAGHRDEPAPRADDVAPYSALMAGSLPLIAADILEAYPVDRHRVLLDVGGGEGAFLEAAATRSSALSLMLFDLPPVAERARDRLQRAGLAGRTTVTGGDVFRDALPRGADLLSLVRVIHDHDDPQALAILRAARAALPEGGVLLLAEPMAGTAGAEAMAEAYFGFYLLAMGQGRPRTPAELEALCRSAGFHRVRVAPTRRPLLTRLIVAVA